VYFFIYLFLLTYFTFIICLVAVILSVHWKLLSPRQIPCMCKHILGNEAHSDSKSKPTTLLSAGGGNVGF